MLDNTLKGLLTGDYEWDAGVENLVSGYVDYAAEVIVDRAIPKIDGLKPSQRRILYTMYLSKLFSGNKISRAKCANIVGDTMKLHPHGDASIYDTLIHMVDSAKYLNVPYIKGKGNFGKVYDTSSPAAYRYTEAGLTNIATEELFRDMQGVQMLSSYDDTRVEPDLLPVTFPSILCNFSRGIAVALASTIPSFNFNELLNATIELIQTGKIAKPLVPDFTTGGDYVYNEKELNKIMTKGSGSIKLRGKWTVTGKTIIISEIPYCTTVQEIIKAANDIQGVSAVRDETGFAGMQIAVEATSKANVNPVLTELLRTTPLQMSMSANICVIVDNKPLTLGVTGLLAEWVKFRKGVIVKSLMHQLEQVKTSLNKEAYLVKLMENTDYVETFVRLARQGESQAAEYLRNVVGITDEAVVNSILDMKIRALSKLDLHKSNYVKACNMRDSLMNQIENPEDVIVSQLKELNEKYVFSRRTTITDTDYVFDKKDFEVKDEPVPVQVIVKDNFLYKEVIYNMAGDPDDGYFKCMSNDVVAIIDNKGRVLRVNLSNVDVMHKGAVGLYIPAYADLPDEEKADFSVIAYTLVEDKIVGYFYSDGFASVVDYSEWVNMQKCTRRTDNGVSPYASLIMSEIDLSKPYMLLLSAEGRMGIYQTDFKRKSRTARTRVANLKKGDSIVSCIPLDFNQMLHIVSNVDNYKDKMCYLQAGDTFNKKLLQEITNSL